MRKLVVVLALIVLCIAACEDTPPLTVQAYADQCAAIARGQGDPRTFDDVSEWRAWVEGQIRDFDRLNPPDELADFHDAYIDVLSRHWRFTSDQRASNASHDRLVMMAWLKYLRRASDDEIIDVYDALPDDTKDILKESMCVDRRY